MQEFFFSSFSAVNIQVMLIFLNYFIISVQSPLLYKIKTKKQTNKQTQKQLSNTDVTVKLKEI